MSNLTKIEKLKKLFPLAFKYSSDVKGVCFSTLIHMLIPHVYAVLATVVIVGLNIVAHTLCSAFGWLCTLSLGILWFPLWFPVSLLLGLVIGLVLAIVAIAAFAIVPAIAIYSVAGAVLSALAYVGVFDADEAV